MPRGSTAHSHVRSSLTTGSLIPSAGAHGSLASIAAIKILAGRGLRRGKTTLVGP